MKITYQVTLLFINCMYGMAAPLVSHFQCKELGNSQYRPYYLKVDQTGTGYHEHRLLGQNPMTSLEECQSAVQNANQKFGVICSRTGLDGWKPTLYTGTLPGRPDFGYLGGSSIFPFEDCLKATRHSDARGVCFWGGSDWFVAPIDREGVVAGPFTTLEECVKR